MFGLCVRLAFGSFPVLSIFLCFVRGALRLAIDTFNVFLSFMPCLTHIAFSPLKHCVSYKIWFSPRKLIGNNRGDIYQRAFVCDFCQALKCQDGALEIAEN